MLLDGERMALQLDLDRDRYVSLLEKLIGEVEYLQDNPPKFVPQEDRYALIALVLRLCLLLHAVTSSHAEYMQCNMYGYLHVA